MWCFFVLGLIIASNGCESRAVNISNTWTLPQQGFNVFYRFFRDKISWFEADAVCQFHHANLVTVDNSVQFDATRNFLKILDVTQSVWIGLMRPQNSQIFAWSNSKPLALSSGYWAESLPLLESPLCAVIDPIRDYRWHALRCGGPETASFLCEMNVPKWARECIPSDTTDTTSLTIQYMADNGSIELSKDCGDEGTIQRVCRSKQDLIAILKELVCINSEEKPELKGNSLISKDLFKTHFKSLEIINNVTSDNNEDNNINTQPQKLDEKKKEVEKNPVQKLIEQFNVDEIMQADQPEEHVTDTTIPKVTKKTMKKAKSFEKKTETVKKLKQQQRKTKTTKGSSTSLEEMMMGDQPVIDLEEAQEPLPHIKKSLSQDLKHHYTTVQVESVKSTTPDDIKEISTTEIINSTPFSTTATTLAPPETKTGSIGHPMHPQQPRGGISSATASEDETAKHSANKESNNDNHFIPPMLLVKSHYTSTKSHLDEQNIAVTNEKIEITTTQNIESTSDTGKTISITTLSEGDSTPHSTQKLPTLAPSPSISTSSSSISFSNEPLSSSIIQLSSPPSTSIDHETVEIRFQNVENQTVFSVTTKPFIETTVKLNEKIQQQQQQQQQQQLSQIQENQKQLNNNEHQNQQNQQSNNISSIQQSNEFPTASATFNMNNHNQYQEGKFSESLSSSLLSTSKEEQIIRTKPKNKFSNEENFQPYKPNRRRSLTKTETTTYLKKILG